MNDNIDPIDQITIGMTANEFFELFPQKLQIKKPTVYKDESDPEKHLIVIHYYEHITVKFEFAKSGDPLLPLNSYSVQEVSYV